MNDEEHALDRYQRSLEIRRRLAEADPKDARLQEMLAYSEVTVAYALLKSGKAPEALERFQTAARIAKAQSGSNTSDARLRSDWAWALAGEGEALDRLGRPDEACPAYRSAWAIYEDLARRGMAMEYDNLEASGSATRAAACRSKQ
jgi:tetratricopeptide (TPR) repeat protein